MTAPLLRAFLRSAFLWETSMIDKALLQTLVRFYSFFGKGAICAKESSTSITSAASVQWQWSQTQRQRALLPYSLHTQTDWHFILVWLQQVCLLPVLYIIGDFLGDCGDLPQEGRGQGYCHAQGPCFRSVYGALSLAHSPLTTRMEFKK
jgi:hypothetical protein